MISPYMVKAPYYRMLPELRATDQMAIKPILTSVQTLRVITYKKQKVVVPFIFGHIPFYIWVIDHASY